MALLSLERISAQYPGAAEPVLSDISVNLGPQQLLVALGPSGSGKTSLLNLIAGFVEPSGGRITLGPDGAMTMRRGRLERTKENE